MENINTRKINESGSKLSSRISKGLIVVALCGALSSCSKADQISRQQRKVAHLEYTLQKQAENYGFVAGQENRQQDLKNEGADVTINQEIGYSHEWATDQDKKISKTKKRLSKAQDKLAKLIENGDPESSSEYSKLNSEKYDYVQKEFE